MNSTHLINVCEEIVDSGWRRTSEVARVLIKLERAPKVTLSLGTARPTRDIQVSAETIYDGQRFSYDIETAFDISEQLVNK